MSDAVARFLTRWRWPLAIAATVLTLAAIVPASRLTLDRSIESLYAADDPRLLDYEESKRLFGGDEFVLVAWTEPKLLERGKLNTAVGTRIRRFADELSRVGGVNNASTQDLDRVIDNAITFAKDAAGDNRFARIIAARYALERQQEALDFSRGILIGADDKTTAVVLRLRPEGKATRPRDETFGKLRAIAARFSESIGRPVAVAGEPVQVFDAYNYVEEDGRRLFYVSLGLLAAVLLALFRSFRWVLLPLAVTAAAVLWTRAVLAIAGSELSMVSSMLNSLVTIVAVATVTHVGVRFRELRRRNDRPTALRRTLSELVAPVFWASATTIAGFLSLIVSDVMPVRSFGVMTALGTGMVLLGAATLVPATATFGPESRRHRIPRGEGKSTPLERALSGLTELARRRGAVIAGLAVLLTAFAAVGVTRMKIETDFSKNFRADSPIVVSLDFFEAHLGGAGTFEVNFPAPPRLTPDYLDKVRGLADRLRAVEIDGKRPLTKVVAITDGLDLLPQGVTTGDPNEDLKQIAQLQPEFVPSLYNPKAKRMRIVLRAYERQGAEAKRAIIERVAAVAQKTFPQAKATGLFVLLTYVIESLLRDQTVSFSIAAVALLVMMAAAFRRPLLAVVAVVPNVLPIIVLLGTMGWLGVPVNIGTAMIASVSLGLTIDSSIHYLSSYRRDRDAGLSVSAALGRSGRHVGVALVFATLALSVGFSVLTLSHFVPLIYFGVLVSLAMLGGLLGNLLLLPALVPWVDREPPAPQ